MYNITKMLLISLKVKKIKLPNLLNLNLKEIVIELIKMMMIKDFVNKKERCCYKWLMS